MLQPLHEDRRQLTHVGNTAPDEVGFEHRDQLVVGLAAVGPQ